MKNQFRYTATHRDGPHRDGRTVAMAPTPPPSAGGGGGGNKSKSYLDDLMSGSVNFMDVQRAKTSSSMRSAGTSSSTARGTPQSHGLSGGRDDFRCAYGETDDDDDDDVRWTVVDVFIDSRG
jgi:hypothetical protein